MAWVWVGHIQAAEATQASGRSYFNCLPHDDGDSERVHASERETAKERALCECVFVCGTYSGLVGELLYVCVPVYLARFYLRPAIPSRARTWRSPRTLTRI